MDYNELLIPTKIIRSKRKSISLIIKNNGDFIIRAPLKSDDKDIFKFVKQKSNWIIKKRTEQKNNAINPLTFDGNEQIFLLGNQYQIVCSNISKVKLAETQIILPNNNSKQKLVLFLKSFAKKYISKRVELLSQLFNLNYTSISITSAKTCWGSCSANNKLHFTFRLVMCPEDVIDYIIVHELCHTKVKNHSARFWALVESCNPNYKTHESWLKKNRAIVELI